MIDKQPKDADLRHTSKSLFGCRNLFLAGHAMEMVEQSSRHPDIKLCFLIRLTQSDDVRLTAFNHLRLNWIDA
uniref:Bm9667 n=1 Tax=Brugia malayi TaxID=6279 RepID=A0A1I9G1Z0_BRUMA|nr:Bm9667 [Brugia malayi]